VLKVTEAEHAGEHRLRLAFNDGTRGVIDLGGRLDGPVFRPLQDASVFAGFRLTDHTLEWPCGADLAPEYLHDLVVSESDGVQRAAVREGWKSGRVRLLYQRGPHSFSSGFRRRCAPL